MVISVTTHHRVRYQDVLAYQEQIDPARSKALDALTEQAQELNMDINELPI